MREKLLALTDILVKRKDSEGLALLRDITLELLCSGFEVENLSLTELNEYIDSAQHAIKEGKESEEIAALSIRKLIDKY